MPGSQGQPPILLLGPVHTAEFHVQLGVESACILHQKNCVNSVVNLAFTLHGICVGRQDTGWRRCLGLISVFGKIHCANWKSRQIYCADTLWIFLRKIRMRVQGLLFILIYCLVNAEIWPRTVEGKLHFSNECETTSPSVPCSMMELIVPRHLQTSRS